MIFSSFNCHLSTVICHLSSLQGHHFVLLYSQFIRLKFGYVLSFSHEVSSCKWVSEVSIRNPCPTERRSGGQARNNNVRFSNSALVFRLPGSLRQQLPLILPCLFPKFRWHLVCPIFFHQPQVLLQLQKNRHHYLGILFCIPVIFQFPISPKRIVHPG